MGTNETPMWRAATLVLLAGTAMIAVILFVGNVAEKATPRAQRAVPKPPDIAAEFIELAWSSRYDEAFALTSPDLRVSGGDAGYTLFYMNPEPMALGGPPDGSQHAEAVLVGYFEYLSQLDTTPLSIECTPGGQIVMSELSSDRVRCTVVATNALLPAGQTYDAVFTMGFRENIIDSIGEVGHPYEGGDLPNLAHPPVENYEALGAAVAPSCGGWRAGATMDPRERPADHEWWIALGRSCAQAWRVYFGA